MNDIFKNQFLKIINEDLEGRDDELMDDPESSEEAFAGTMDDGTDPEEYSINPNDVRQITKANVMEASKWVEILQDFAKLINSVDDKDSLNNFLNKVDFWPNLNCYSHNIWGWLPLPSVALLITLKF